jgi:hypothetical protein
MPSLGPDVERDAGDLVRRAEAEQVGGDHAMGAGQGRHESSP